MSRFPLPSGTFDKIENLTNDDGLLAVLNLIAADGSLGSVPMQDIWWVGKHGLDSNPGTSLERAFLTFNRAITAASAGDAIVCLDGGTYTERLNVPASINIYAPLANLIGTGAGALFEGALMLRSGFYQFRSVTAVGIESAVVRLDFAGTAIVYANLITIPDGASSGLMNASFFQAGVLVGRVDRIVVGASGFGVYSSTLAGVTKADVGRIELVGNSATGISQVAVSGSLNICVQHILEQGSYTTTKGINQGSGRIDAMVSVISADTAWSVTGSGVLSIFYNQATGAVVETGTVLKSTPV
jgi:hypothetical protein